MAEQIRIRAQAMARDSQSMRFILDAPVQEGEAARFEGPGGGAPLALALFSLAGVQLVQVEGATIFVTLAPGALWEHLKVPVAAAIRGVLSSGEPPLGAPEARAEAQHDQDAALLVAVAELLDARANPSIASHGGKITAESVTGGVVYLRMSGGCQGCASSTLTLRRGVETMLRSALPAIRDIVDVTDHSAGANPFYRHGPGQSPLHSPPLAPGAARDPAPASPEDAEAKGRSMLAAQIRRELDAQPPQETLLNYGAIARRLGLVPPGVIGRVTEALELTMREDAAAGRPFVAARAVSRATGLPGKGFFDLARALGRGPRAGETDADFHRRCLDG